MKKKLLNEKSISKQCCNCSHGKLSPDEQAVLCEKRGIMRLDSSCRKYEYDPLRRRPGRLMPKQEHDPAEFIL